MTYATFGGICNADVFCANATNKLGGNAIAA
jgi:hypothetical protein